MYGIIKAVLIRSVAELAAIKSFVKLFFSSPIFDAYVDDICVPTVFICPGCNSRAGREKHVSKLSSSQASWRADMLLHSVQELHTAHTTLYIAILRTNAHTI